MALPTFNYHVKHASRFAFFRNRISQRLEQVKAPLLATAPLAPNMMKTHQPEDFALLLITWRKSTTLLVVHQGLQLLLQLQRHVHHHHPAPEYVPPWVKTNTSGFRTPKRQEPAAALAFSCKRLTKERNSVAIGHALPRGAVVDAVGGRNRYRYVH
ncbi:hypothetical protein BDZ91DRAFT_803011 [Kalaharituber pfeilii]|nr:hypothetical protein BDZ91DRAFT_803011 [Kalaharituber pfeilii]